MLSKYAKIAAKIFIGALLFTIVYSLIYNQPIRFRPKMRLYDRTVHTLYPSSKEPDQIMLSPLENSGTGVRIQWRASEGVKTGEVRYWEGEAGEYAQEAATLKTIEARELKKDSRNNYFSASLENLEPAASYRYIVGDPSLDIWSAPRTFIMPPKNQASFSFIYFGDVQEGTREFGELLKAVNSRYPETALYLLGGDLVENGDWRYMWDAFAEATSEVFSTKPVAATLGNHDYRQGRGYGREYFRALFNLPDNGPKGYIGSYSFKHDNVQFVVLDSNLDAKGQSAWLEEQLKKGLDADFTIVMFHHPPYGRERDKNGPDVAKHWAPLFDRYGVDLVLNAHDHIYRRSKKMWGGDIVPDGEDGVTYIIAYSCSKEYKMTASEYAQLELENTPTYQVVTVENGGEGKPVLHYKAYDFGHRLVDECTLE